METFKYERVPFIIEHGTVPSYILYRTVPSFISKSTKKPIKKMIFKKIK